MQQADLSIGMAGYNTTMNILSTGVKAMMMAFQGNNDQEQETRLKKLAKLGRVKMIQPEDLIPRLYAKQIIRYLQQDKTDLLLNLAGVDNTAKYIKRFCCQKINRQIHSVDN
jgi:predicted glycosyltransferase